MAEGWQPIVTRMLENYCITWGGAADLLIPIGDDGTLHPAFWRLIEIFDADIWASYVHTVRGWEMADPAAYHEWLEREAKKWARRHGGGIRAARETLRADHILSDVIYQWEPPEQLANQVRKCSSPVFEHDRLISAAFQADSPPDRYLVNVLDLTPLPERLMRLDTSELKRSVQLLLASRYGALAPSHERTLEDAGVHIDVVSTADVELGLLLELAWTGTHDDTHLMLRRALGDHIPGHPLLQAANSLETAATLAVVGCRRMARFYPDADQLPLVVVAGSHVDDFCFVHALERCGVPALWLPADLALGDDANGRSTLDVLGQCLEHSGERIWRRRPKLLTSLSLSSDELTAIRERLSASTWRPTIDLVVADEVPLPTHRIPAIRDPENYDCDDPCALSRLA